MADESTDRGSLTASGARTARSRNSSAESRINAFRREQADKAIARIEWCYQQGLAIPDVR